MAANWTEPIEIATGAKVCDSNGQNEALIERITERGVAFTVKGGRDFTCPPESVCQFDWPGAPSAYFRVVIDTVSSAGPLYARMLPRR